MITLSILPNYFFGQFAVIIALPGSLLWPSWRLAAILELFEHPNSIVVIDFIFYMRKYISDLKNITFLTAHCHFTTRWHYTIGDGGHLGFWQPYWKDLKIWTVFTTLFEHLLLLKYKIHYHNCPSQPSAAPLKQTIGFHDSPWRPNWKMAAILKFCVARVFFLKSDPNRVFVPNLLLVS